MKIAVITGASSGIGKEFVYAVDKEYELDEIWVIARRTEELEKLQAECRNKIVVRAMDLLQDTSLDLYGDLLKIEKPQIEVLVNAAGFGHFGLVKDQDLQGQLNMIRLNSMVLTAMCRLSLDYMHEGSAIINLGSNSSWQPVPIMAVYGASKSYVLNFSRALWRELQPSGIKVMCVCPGWVKTGFQAVAGQDEYIKYVDKWYGPKEVADQAMLDLKAGKIVSILGAGVANQVRMVKFAPVKFVMNVWCRQQGIK